MKSLSRYFSLLSVICILGLSLATSGCGSNGTTGHTTAGNTPSVDPGDGTDFSGTYVLRVQDCEPFDGIYVFTVEQTGTDLVLTVNEADGDDYSAGDEITGDVNEISGVTFATVSELNCAAILMTTQADVDDANLRNSENAAQIGDLDAFCNDSSDDSVCTLIYQHSST